VGFRSSLRPFVEAPTFGEFLHMKKLCELAAHRAVRLATRVVRPGYGKIAVYANRQLAGDN